MEKKMFRYYQTEEKGAWNPITDSDDVESIVLDKRARKLTILSVSELVNDDSTDKLDLSYKGPLYFDIDIKGDLDAAIDSCKRLVENLLERGVVKNDIRLFCSGSKGMHVLVSQKVFSNGKAQKRLPWIYREMALSMFVPGVDFQVYSTGRGNSFRITGVQRADGAYRTPISYDELEDLTSDSYKEICATPRVNYRHPDWVNEKSTDMEVLYEGAKLKAAKRQRVAGALPEASLKKISNDIPNCLAMLADFKQVPSEKSFNAVAMQVGILIARSGMEPQVYTPAVDRLAENSASSNTGSRSRKEELDSQIRYMRASPGYQFSCAAMRDLLNVRPCEGCPIETEGSSLTGAGSAGLGIEKRPEGYYFIGRTADIRVSTFTLTPVSVVIDRPQDGSPPRRAYTIMDVESDGINIGEISFGETGWKSSSNFKDEISGLRNLAFMGSDDHVQRIKHMTYNEEEAAGEIMQVYTAGIHIESRHSHKVFTYVEPGYSVNNVKVEDTYKLKGRILCPPVFSGTPICKKGDQEADAAMLAALSMNKNPISIAQTIGWFVACHLKTHLVDMYNQFPILSVWGNAGSGKSKTIEVYSALCGLDPIKDTPVNISTPTAYAVLEYAASTTTIPRVMEEYNRSKMLFKNYTMVGETLKAAWGGETIAKGTLAKRSNQSGGRTGAYVEAIKVSAPCCTVSEQAPEMPALIHRSIQVMFKQSDLEGKEMTYLEAREGMLKLREIGKFLMLTALCNTREASLKDWMEASREFVPKKLDERPRYSLQVLWVSLHWLQTALEKLELPESSEYMKSFLIPEFKKYLELLEEEATSQRGKVKTEIDAVIESLATMAALTYQGEDYIKHGMHFLTTDDHVYIDPATCHILYKKFRQSYEREPAVIATVAQFVVLLKSESYYEGDEFVEEISKNRFCMKLNKRKMADKGLNVTLFDEG